MCVCMGCVANFDNPFPEDADDVEAPALPAVSSSSSDEDDDDSDAEEEEALLRELNKIKKERMEEEKAKVRQTSSLVSPSVLILRIAIGRRRAFPREASTCQYRSILKLPIYL